MSPSRKRIDVPATAALFLAFAAVCCTPAPDADPLVVYLVRHAEKVDQGEDPGLSEAGRDRASVLAETLRNAGIDHVHSSDYARTRETAEPLAEELGLDVELYDPRDLSGLAERLRRTGGRHLVVGHSNTTPQVVELLGGEPGPPIDDGGEFDRLYVVTVGRDGDASTETRQYGSPFDPAQD